MADRSAESDRFVIPPRRHNHKGGEACPGCVYNMMMERDDGFIGGHAVATEAGAETLATARRVSSMYFLRTKDLAAVLLDARGLVRGLDPALDERIDTTLKAAGFLSTSPEPSAH